MPSRQVAVLCHPDVFEHNFNTDRDQLLHIVRKARGLGRGDEVDLFLDDDGPRRSWTVHLQEAGVPGIVELTFEHDGS